MENTRVYLRALEPDDHKLTHVWRLDPGYVEGVVSQKRFSSFVTEQEWVAAAIVEHQRGKTYRFILTLKKNDEPIGLFTLSDVDLLNRNALDSRLIAAEHRGQGFAAEGAFLVCSYAFLELGLERVSGYVLESNTSSLRAFEKFGYRQEGVLRNAVYKNGRYQNVVVHSILKSEFLKKYSKGLEDSSSV